MPKINTWVPAAVLGAAFLLCATAAFSQVDSVSGTVRDDKGRPIPGAPVEVIKPQKGIRLTPSDGGPAIYFTEGPEEKVATKTDSTGSYKVETKGRAWQPGADYVVRASTPSKDIVVEKKVQLGLGATTNANTRVSVLEPSATGSSVSRYPQDYSPGVYAKASAGAMIIDRSPIKFGRPAPENGPASVGIDPAEISSAAGATVGYQLDHKQGVEMTFAGAWNEIVKKENTPGYGFPLIDASASLGANTPAHFFDRYNSSWNDLGLDYTYRLLEKDPWTVVVRGGIAGGFSDQTYQSELSVHNRLLSDIDEKVEDHYVGPRIGAELQYRFWQNFYAGVGLNVGAAIGSSDLTANQRARTPLGVNEYIARDSMDYTAMRLGSTIGLGWAPRRWLAFELGYRIEYWSDSPRIENPDVSGLNLAPSSTTPAHLGNESLLFHGVTGTVNAKFW